jgi:hypothetical protein
MRCTADLLRLEPSATTVRAWSIGVYGLRMAYPALEVRGRRIILLSGYKRMDANEQRDSRSRSRGEAQDIVVSDWDRLVEATYANSDAVAFGYTAGRWVAAA